VIFIGRVLSADSTVLSWNPERKPSMNVLAIIAALLLEQWRPLGDRKSLYGVASRWSQWVEESFNAGEARHGTIAWLVAVGLAVLGSALAWWLLSLLHPLLGLLFNVAALYLTLGFRQFSHHFTAIQAALREGELDRARELISAWRDEPLLPRTREEVVRLTIEESIAASHRHVFGVLLWFMLLPGPSGAILYRLSHLVRRRWAGLGAFGRFAVRAHAFLEWPAARLTAIAFAVVGDFEDAVYCWRTQAAAWPDREQGIVLAAGAGAMGVRLGLPISSEGGMAPRPELGIGEAADVQYLDSAVGLLWRALVLWVFMLVVVGLARAV
jgi:adenosylcobinamide-phosphate synthase